MTSLNVFALTGAAAEPFVEAGHRIEFVSCDTVYAAVERIEERPALSEDSLRTQHAIVAQVAERVDAVLPARFGSVVDAGELTRLVVLRRDAIGQALDLVRGRVQMTVRRFTSLVRSAAPALPAARSGPISGTAYLQERRSAATPVLSSDIDAITAAVRGLVASERAEAGHGHVAATVYHLVDRGTVEAYTDAIDALRSHVGTDTLTVSGPWPPFAFVPDLWA
ncbi:MAG: GvpL/GvpF family gas vesicle protein [Acidobacteriota bacterium]